jgi:hypothetical protein
MKINSKFILPKWDNHLTNWQKLNEQVTSMLLKIYNSSPSFMQYYTLFRSISNKNKIRETLKNDYNSVLPFAFIMHSDEKFYTAYFNKPIIDAILIHKNEISLRTGKLIHHAFLNNLNDGQKSMQVELKKRICNEIKSNELYNTETLTGIGVFSENPVTTYAKLCIEKNIEPETLLISEGISLYNNSKFLKLTKIATLLIKLKKLNFKNEHNLSRQIIKKSLFNLEYRDKLLVGHEIIKIVLESNNSVSIHKSWTQMILSIASDPRASSQSKLYLKWWSKLDQKLIDKFIKILSHNEILLFLDAISKFASSKNSEMSRMFKSRKQLLVGLSIQNKIERSRLFLPEQVKEYIKKENPKLDLSFICTLSGSQNKCVIYLKIGDFHMIEGSHNCKIRIYKEYPSKYKIFNPRLKEINYTKITTGMEFHYTFNSIKPYAMVHHPNGSWKKGVIKLLKSNMELDIDKLLTNEEINTFRYY